MTWLLPLLKYWRVGATVLLLGSLSLFAYLTRERGREIAQLESEVQTLRQNYTATVKMMEKAYIEENNRHDFKLSQSKKFQEAGNPPAQFDPALRAAYERLRQRQQDAGSSR